MTQIQRLVDAVEQSILDLCDWSRFPVLTTDKARGTPIQPLRVWTNQDAVLTFKDILRNRFRGVLNDIA